MNNPDFVQNTSASATTYISSCHHDTIRFGQNLVVIFQTLLVFNLGNNLDAGATIVHQELAKIFDILSGSDKGRRNEFDPVLDSKIDNVIDILFGKGWQGNLDSGKIHVFAFSNRGIVLDAAGDLLGGDVALEDCQHKRAVGNQNFLSLFDVLGHLIVRAGQFGAIDGLVGVITRQDELLALGQFEFLHDGRVKESGSNLGTLGIQKDYFRLDLLQQTDK